MNWKIIKSGRYQVTDNFVEYVEAEERKGCPLLNKMDLFEFLKVKGVEGD